jgi:predicted TPR repeat methyltransferase
MSEIRRDPRFIAQHRGGTLTLEEHHQLVQWAVACVQHVIMILKVQAVDERISQALDIACQWIAGEVTVGDARKAAVATHAAARETEDTVMKNLARAAGHAVATAHMADHAPGAAAYVLKACKAVGGDELVAQELAWQQAQLPEDIRERVLSAYPRVLRMVK